MEDAFYDSQALRTFAGIALGAQPVPDATTLLGFRHLLAANNLARVLLAKVNAPLGERGVLLREGTIIDATIIAAPSSTKNQERARDPEMRQVKKGNAWHFGMKAHIGVDLASGLVHTVAGTSANVADVAQAHVLLHGEEKQVFADAGYQGVAKRPEIAARFGTTVRFEVAAKRGKLKAMAEGRRKAQLRVPVEHPFHIIAQSARKCPTAVALTAFYSNARCVLSTRFLLSRRQKLASSPFSENRPLVQPMRQPRRIIYARTLFGDVGTLSSQRHAAFNAVRLRPAFQRHGTITGRPHWHCGCFLLLSFFYTKRIKSS